MLFDVVVHIHFNPCLFARMLRSNVVLPDPRKPDRTVTGSLSSDFLVLRRIMNLYIALWERMVKMREDVPVPSKILGWRLAKHGLTQVDTIPATCFWGFNLCAYNRTDGITL